jgi:hypothetical protein
LMVGEVVNKLFCMLFKMRRTWYTKPVTQSALRRDVLFAIIASARRTVKRPQRLVPKGIIAIQPRRRGGKEGPEWQHPDA